MTQNWISQVFWLVLKAKILTHFCIEFYLWKVDIVLKISVNITIFWVQTVLMFPDQISSNLHVSNKYNGNIEIFWYRELNMKIWYNWNFFCWNFLFLLCGFLCQNLFQYFQLTYYWCLIHIYLQDVSLFWILNALGILLLSFRQ